MKNFIKLATTVTALLITTVQAVESEEWPRSRLVDTWGSVLFCREIYQEPGIRDRIYAGDREACERAHISLATLVLDHYPEEQAGGIARDAARKAGVIRYNTRSVQDAVPACRQQCTDFEAIPH